MHPDLRLHMAAGPRSYPWAERLSAEWRQVGMSVELESDLSGDAYLVRLVAVGAAVESELYLDRRKNEMVGPFLCFEVAAEKLRARERVNFRDLADLNFDFMETWSSTDRPGPKIRNSWDDLYNWLERNAKAAAAVLLSHLSEVYSFAYICELDAGQIPLLEGEGDKSSHWLLRAEVRRLILQARYLLLEKMQIDQAVALLRPAADLCREIGDPALATRVEALRGAAMVESYRDIREKGFARMEKARRRAERLRDGPAALEIGETIAYLENWWCDSSKALKSLEATADFFARSGLWTPPRLGHLLRLHRALAAPCRETVMPLVEEVLEVMGRGESTWTASLDHLDQLQRVVGEETFIKLLAPILGKHNARGLAAISYHGRKEDRGRRKEVEGRKWLSQRSLDLARDRLRFLAIGG
jgi:hypothetical protein